MPKGTCQVEVTLNSEKIKPVVLAVIELHLSEVIRQSVSQQKISLNIFSKFCSNLLKALWVDLKVCSGLVLLNQYCLIVIWEN